MNIASSSLKAAVHKNSIVSSQGIQQRFFSLWFNSFIYNQIWEDPKVDADALKIDNQSQILTISSAGCNVLNYLVHDPARIVAVDLNPYHMTLTRLKLEAVRHIPEHDAFYEFLGYANSDNNIDLYHDHIKPNLADVDADFWESPRLWSANSRLNFFKNDFYRYTRFGYFIRFLHFIGRKSGLQTDNLLRANSLEEQKIIFKEEIEPFFNNRFVKIVGQLPFSVFSLGIPPQQYKVMKNEGNIIEQFRQRVERLACQFPVRDNYFAWQAFSLSYDHENRQAIPDYLKAEHFSAIKANQNRVETLNISLLDYLQEQPDNSLNRFVFLDAQDWMSDAVLNQLWEMIYRVGKPDSRIIFRTAGAESPVEHALKPELHAKFRYHQVESEALFQQDRSAIYGGFHLYTLESK